MPVICNLIFLLVLVSWNFLIFSKDLLEALVEKKALLKMQEFASQDFLQNCSCLDLHTVCEIFSIFDLVILLKKYHLSKVNKRQSNPFEKHNIL